MTQAATYRPKLDFMIVGAQKCGTTALREYLRRHPQICMPADECHLFDDPTFSPAWSAQEIDERYATMFPDGGQATVFGEASPIYMFLPEVAPALHRYSPGLKLIVLLRDRVERAVSQYYMNKIRGDESAPLWWALLLEPLRIHRSSTREWQSNIRTCSYRRRGLYSVQLQNLYRYFPRSQIHVIRSLDLRKDHRAVLRQLFAFLGVAEDVDLPARIVSPTGPYNRERHRVLSWILRTTYLREHIRFKTLGI